MESVAGTIMGTPPSMNYIDPVCHPLLDRIAQEADWPTEDEFPAAPEWADLYEERLRFVDSKGELNRFVPRLRKSPYQRDRTLAEIEVAYFLEKMRSLPIIEWEPPGTRGTRGEFLIGSPTAKIFVEVKTGGWEKDIKDAEGKDAVRLSQPKYLNAEARSVAPWASIRNAVANAYKKFPDSMATLLVIKDDYFIPLDDFNADLALYCPAAGSDQSGYLAENGCFVDYRYERLGGVGILNQTLSDGRVRYSFSVYDNPNALSAVKLPQDIFGDDCRRNAPQYRK
jgi:hypothetical protein